MPLSLRLLKASDAGSRSCSSHAVRDVFTTFSYLLIFVMKFLRLKSSEMGILTRKTVR